MKNKKQTKIAVGLLLAALVPAYAFSDMSFKVANIDVIDETTLEVWVNDDLAEQLAIDTDMQVVEDTNMIQSATPDYEDSTKVEIKLNDDLVSNEYYSLLSIAWADGNIAFSFPENFYEQDNTIIEGDELSGIISMEIENARTLIVNFEAAADNDVEMKLIRELWVNNLEKSSSRTVKISLDKKMKADKDYTLTVIKLVSKDDKEIDLENSTIDFVAPDFAPKPELKAAPEETVETMATAKKELPPTGTKENIIIILSLMLSWAVFYRRNTLKNS